MASYLIRSSLVLLLWPVVAQAQVITYPPVNSVAGVHPSKEYATPDVRQPTPVAPEATCNFYAAANGTANGVGSKAQPWDLQTSLNQPAALTPGSTLCLRGGTYTGFFVSTIEGEEGNLITVRSAPGEWAVLDGYVASTLTADITAEATRIPVVDASAFPTSLALAFDVSIGTDVFKIYQRTGNNLHVYFGLDTGHPLGAEIVVRGAALAVYGSHVIVRDFEITSSDPIRTDALLRQRAVGLNMFAPESLALNLVIHDTSQGLSFWEQSRNSVACGNILYNNGVKGKGHGIYTQNEVGTKLLCDNITFGNFGLGMQMYTTNGGTQIGFTFDGNINVNNRYLFGGQKPMDDLTISNNFLYGASLELGYGDAGPHGRAVVTGNYVYAGSPFVALNWHSVAVTNNKFYMMPDLQSVVMRVDLPANGSITNYTFTNNDYLLAREWQVPPFILRVGTASMVGYQFATTWRTATGDTTSTYRGATQELPTIPRPTGLDVFYRANPYETGRGHIIIYNHEGESQVSLDLARVGLPTGQPYQIRSGQDYLAPPITVGVYNGGVVSVSLSALAVAQPFTDNGERNLDTCPKFCVFVVVPQPVPPGTFGKAMPASGATNQPTSPTLSWSASSSAVSYEYCYDTTNDNACGTWTSNGANTSVDLSGFAAGVTYYWHVRVVNSTGATYSNGAPTEFWSFTTQSDTPVIIHQGGGQAYVDSHNGGKPGSEIHPTLNADAIGDKFLNNRSAGRSFSGLGQTGSRFSYPDTQTWFAGWRFYPADFNGDGRPDLLLHEQQTGTFFVATANASGFTYQQGSWPVGWMPVVADLNADGYDDLVLHDPDTGEWFEVISDGAGGFTSALVSCSYVNGTQAAGLTIVAQPAIR